MPDVILRNLPFLLDCLRMTAELAVVSAASGTVLGLAVATARYLRLPLLSPILRSISSWCEERRCSSCSSSVILQFLPCSATGPPPLAPRVYRIILFIGAYIAEDIRAGLASVPQGIVDAGLASGLRPIQVLRLIVLPQGLRRVIPVLFSQYVRLFKFTSVASVIGVREMTGGAMLINAREFAPITILIAIAASYLVICSAISLGGRLLYQRLAVQS